MRSDDREPLGLASGEKPSEPTPPPAAEKRGAAPGGRRGAAPPPGTPRRRRGLWAVLVVAVVVIAAAAAALALSNNQNWRPGDYDGGTITDSPLNVNKPETINQTAANISLAVSYPGQGQLDSYSFKRGEPVTFQVTSTPINGYKGPVLTKVFVTREPGGISQEGIQHTYGNNQSVKWTFSFDNDNGTHWGSSDAGKAWQSDGPNAHQEDLNLVFNRTGTYNVTFQSFDPDTGKAVSQPLSASPINVPEAGTLKVVTVGDGERQGGYYLVQINITNDWNHRRDVNATDLVATSKSGATIPDPERTSFKSQSLDIGQSTQFAAYFKLPDDPIQLEYRDHQSGQTVQVPINSTKPA